MIDFSFINKALKCLWVKCFSLNENASWTVIANEATSLLGGFNFLVTCNCNNKDIKLTVLPTFYQKTLKYWFEFKNVRDGVKPHTMKTVIWNNRDIKVDNKTIFFRSWFEKGVSTLDSLLDSNLDFLRYEEFKTRYQLRTNFLTYLGVINAIPKHYKRAINQAKVQQEQLTQQHLNLQTLTTKGIHKVFVNHLFEEPTMEQHLVDNGLREDQLSIYFNLAFSFTKETRLTMFQYKILHNIVFTKSKLLNVGLANCDLCYLCSETKQDLIHMLVLCHVVSKFWDAFREWYESHVNTQIELTTVKILYGIIGNNRLNKLTNHLILIAKYSIYCCSINADPWSINFYQAIVENKAEIEKQISTRNNSPESYYNKWKPLIDKVVLN